MKLKFRYLDQIVGAFILSMLLAVILLSVGIGRGKEWFVSHRNYVLVSKAAGGIAIGTEVLLDNDLKVGNVTDINMSGNNEVRIHIRVKSIYSDRIRSDSEAQIRSTLFSGSKIYLVIGKSAEVLEENDYIPATNEGGLFSNLPNALKKTEETLEVARATFQKLNRRLDEMEDVLVDLKDPQHGLSAMLQSYRSVAEELRSGNGFLGRMIRDEELFDRLKKDVSGLELALEDVQSTTHDLKRFSSELPSMAVKMGQSIQSIREVSTEMKFSLRKFNPVIESARDTFRGTRRITEAMKNSAFFSQPDAPPAVLGEGQRPGLRDGAR